MAKRTIVWTETAAKQRRQILKYWTERNQSTTFAVKLIEIIVMAFWDNRQDPKKLLRAIS
jgi:plasmid stabilization system protein ParE